MKCDETIVYHDEKGKHIELVYELFFFSRKQWESVEIIESQSVITITVHS